MDIPPESPPCGTGHTDDEGAKGTAGKEWWIKEIEKGRKMNTTGRSVTGKA